MREPEVATDRQPLAGNLRWELVRRIAVSSQFAKSVRLKAFLFYIAERSLTGRTGEITEQQIGIYVFGRGTDYNPAEDNIVRVSARLLRNKLKEYFDGPGADEPEVKEIPKGSYLPLFQPRPEVPEPPVKVRPRRYLPAWPAAAVMLLLAAVCVWLWIENRAQGAAAGARPNVENLVSNFLLTGDRQAVMVTADSSLVAMQRVTHQNLSLEDYAERKYFAKTGPGLSRETRDLWDYLLTRPYTSIADLTLYSRIVRLNPGAAERLTIRHARSLQSRDFKQGNFIIVGSPRSNPWGQIFDPNLNFRFRYWTEYQKTGVTNVSPRAGERAEYLSAAPAEVSGEGYALISVLPNSGENGTVFLIGGTSSEATEAAGEFALNPETAGALRRRFQVNDLRKVESFQLLLRTFAIGGSSRSATLLADRVRLRP